MKRFYIVVLLTLLMSGYAGAQPRWMVDLDGSAGLHSLAPWYSAGVELSCYLFRSGPFEIGIGSGLHYSLPFNSIVKDNRRYVESYTIPVFLRGEYDFSLRTTHLFGLVDVGYQLPLSQAQTSYPEAPFGRTRKDLMGMMTPANDASFFISPEIGINFGRRFFAAAGFWFQWITWDSIGSQPYEPTASATLRIGVRF